MNATSLRIVRVAALLGVGIVPAVLVASRGSARLEFAAVAGVAAMGAGLVLEGLGCARALGRAEAEVEAVRHRADLLEKKGEALVARLREAACLDEATGVLNRRAFFDRLEEAIERDARLRRPLAVLLVDVDGFRHINETKGRITGDAALRSVALILCAATRGTDFVGRVGGDEFAIVLGECEDPRPAADRIFVAMNGSDVGEGDGALPLRVNAGGVAIPRPQEGVDVSELFRLAERALTPLRGRGGGLYRAESYAARPVGVTVLPA